MKKVFNWDSKRGIYKDEYGLTPYHYMRSAKGKKAVEEMMKRPYTYEQAEANLDKLRAERLNSK